MKLQFLVVTLMAITFFTGCGKDVSVYNKPAVFWYEKLNDAVADESLEKADGYYSSLQSEHIGSPLLKEATLILAQAHMGIGEYLLAEHFLDEYINRFANPAEREFAMYLKVRAKFMALPNPRRDQTLIHDALAEGESFVKKYPHSYYMPAVHTMLVKLYLAREQLNQTIASLYGRLDKPVAQQYYKDKQIEKWIDWKHVTPPNTAWYREMYEGDGTASWYADWIPDSQSIISQDADGNEKETSEGENLSPNEADTYKDNLREDKPLS